MGDGLQENKMGVMPVGKLLLTMSAPLVASMLFQAFYNIVGGIWSHHFMANRWGNSGNSG